MPLVAGSQSWGQEIRIEWPPRSSQAVRIRRPAKVTTKTVGSGPTARLGKRARKSFTPQESAATSPSRTELISDA